MAHRADRQTMQLVLIRHGESEWNKLNLFTGWTDVELTDTGREEAAAGGRALKEAGFDFDVCYTSRLKRAIHTLNIVLGQMDSRVVARSIKSWKLNERPLRCVAGSQQGRCRRGARRRTGAHLAPLLRCLPAGTRAGRRARPPHPEQYREHRARPDALYRVPQGHDRPRLALFRRRDSPQMLAGKRVLIAAHGNSLRSLVLKLEHLTPEETQGQHPTGVPLIYTFDTDFNVLDKRYIGDPATIAAKIDAVANQGKAHK